MISGFFENILYLFDDFFRMRGSQSPEFMIHASRIVQVETTSVTRTWF